MQILNRPKCRNFEKCNNEALGLVGKMWLCGNCIVKLQEKMDKLREEIFIEEDGNNRPDN